MHKQHSMSTNTGDHCYTKVPMSSAKTSDASRSGPPTRQRLRYSRQYLPTATWPQPSTNANPNPSHPKLSPNRSSPDLGVETAIATTGKPPQNTQGKERHDNAGGPPNLTGELAGLKH